MTMTNRLMSFPRVLFVGLVTGLVQSSFPFAKADV